MPTLKPYTHRTFIAFCSKHQLTYFRSIFGYSIRQWPLSQFIFKFKDNRVLVEHCPVTSISYDYEAQSFEECLAKICHRNPTNLIDLINQFPWETVIRIISSSAKIGTTSYLESFLQQYGCHLPSGKLGALTKYISERNTSVKPLSSAKPSPTSKTFRPTSYALTQDYKRKKHRACSVPSAKRTKRTYPPPTL